MKKDEITRRAKGTGSIGIRSNGSYCGRIKIQGYQNFTCYGKTEKEVNSLLIDFKNKTIRGEAINRKIFIGSYISDWLKDFKKVELKPSSYDRLESTFLNHVNCSNISRFQLGNITANDIQKLINEKAKTLSYSSIKKIYELLNACLSHAVLAKDLDFNPVKAVTMPKRSTLKQTKEIEVFSKSELERIEAVAVLKFSTGRYKHRYAFSYIIMANCGIRVGEMLALNWDCVDFENKKIKITSNVNWVKNRNQNAEKKTIAIVGSVKTKKGNREIPLNDKALKALTILKNEQERNKIITNHVVATGNGNMVLKASYQRLFDKVLVEAKIKHRGLHSLRHTFATNLIDQGVDIKVVSSLIGHESVNTTYNIYVHTSYLNYQEAVLKLDDTIAIKYDSL